MQDNDWRRRRIRFLLTKAERNLGKLTQEKEFWRPRFCRAFFDWCDSNAFDAPQLAVERATIALDISKKTNDRHIICRAMALLASGYRIRSEYVEASRIIEEAMTVAEGCPCCLCDVYRRKGILHLYQSENKTALRYLDLAIGEYERIHDTDGIGRTLVSRGIARYHLSGVDDALADQDEALKLLSGESPQIFHLAALSNIAGFLVLGEERHFLRASQHLTDFRERLVGVEGFTSVRVRLRWIDGLLLARLGEYRRAIQMLENVQDALIKLRQDSEVIAVSADLARLYYRKSNYRAIARAAQKCLRVLRIGGKIRAAVDRVYRSAKREAKRTLKDITALRAAVNVAVPCFIAEIPLPIFSNPEPSG